MGGAGGGARHRRGSSSSGGAAADSSAPTGPISWYTVYEGKDEAARIGTLDPATRYWVRVQAVNSAGKGAYSEPMSVWTLPAPPGPPEAAEVVGSCTVSSSAAWVDLRWRPPSPAPACAVAAGYEVVAKLALSDSSAGALPSPSSVTPLPSPLGGGVAARLALGKVTECRLEGLVPGTAYVISLRSVGAEGAGHSNWGDDVLFTTAGRKPSAGSGGGSAGGGGTGKGGKGKGKGKGAGGSSQQLALLPPPSASVQNSEEGSSGSVSRAGGMILIDGEGAAANGSLITHLSAAATKAQTARRAVASGSAKKVLAAAQTATAARPAKRKTLLQAIAPPKWARRCLMIILAIAIAYAILMYTVFQGRPYRKGGSRVGGGSKRA